MMGVGLEKTIVKQVINLQVMEGNDSEFCKRLQKGGLWVQVDWWHKIQAGHV